MKTIMTICLAIAGLCSMRPADATEKDREFVNEATEAALLEIKLGELSKLNSMSADVKKLGARMVKDHGKSSSELKSLAYNKGMSLPVSLGEKNQEKYNELAQKKGEDFDKAYLECMIDNHQRALNMYERQEKAGDDSDLKTFAAKHTPILEHHIYLTKKTRDKLKEKKK